MLLDIPVPNLRLDTGQVVTLDDARGREIVPREGCVWVTEEGDPRDHVVCPGDSRVVKHDGRTIVQALSPSWVRIQ